MLFGTNPGPEPFYNASACCPMVVLFDAAANQSMVLLIDASDTRGDVTHSDASRPELIGVSSELFMINTASMHLLSTAKSNCDTNLVFCMLLILSQKASFSNRSSGKSRYR